MRHDEKRPRHILNVFKKIKMCDSMMSNCFDDAKPASPDRNLNITIFHFQA
jgi:hypothetical protein